MEDLEKTTSLLSTSDLENNQTSRYSAVPVNLSDSEESNSDYDSIETLPKDLRAKGPRWSKIFLLLLGLLILALVMLLAASSISYFFYSRNSQNAIQSIREQLSETPKSSLIHDSQILVNETPNSGSEDLLNSNTKKLFQFEDINSGNFRARSPSLKWVETENQDGLYSYEDELTGQIRISRADSKWDGRDDYKVLIGRNIIDKFEPDSPFVDYIISPDLKFIAIVNYWEKVWRHSYTAKYRIFDLSDINKPPITVSPHPNLNFNNVTNYISLFKWSTSGHDVTFVFHNDVYILANNFKSTIRVTNDGSPEIINGIPDWVYEEEVFAGNSATWWSPNGKYIAYLSFDDRPVPEVQIPLNTNGAILNHANLIAPSNIPLTAPMPDPKDIPNFLSSYASYPQYVKFKYPKSGFNNSVVKLNVFQVKDKQGKYFSIENFKKRERKRTVKMNFDNILSSRNPRYVDLVNSLNSDVSNWVFSDVVWSLQTEALIVRFTNRAQDIVATAIVNFDSSKQKALKGKVVRLEAGGLDFSPQSNKKGDGGWYQTDSHPILPIPLIENIENRDSKVTGYIDRVVLNGYYHLALFSSLKATKPSYFLTEGSFDIDGAIGFDVLNGRLYYMSREMDSTASHIYSVDLRGKNKIHISNEREPSLASLNTYNKNKLDSVTKETELDHLGVFSGEMSPKGKYLLLSYLGPHVPYHVLVKEGKISKAIPLEKNTDLREFLNQYDLPKTHFSRVVVNGTELNSMEIFPPKSVVGNKNKKLRVLFRCYGGPESQLVSRKFRFDFHTWLVSNLTDVAVVVVDGRGTGFKGRKFAVGITGNLGAQEAQDQLGAIKEYSKYDWVTPDHLGLWGWSYGGYLTAKSVEADDNGLLSAAISVAPVSDWRFYDSIYTERYMKTPQSNPHGYSRSAVNRVNNFNRTSYLLMHGASDDNVHLENSMRLIDLFNRAKITRAEFFMFPDNDHSVSAPYSNRALYTRLYQHIRDRL